MTQPQQGTQHCCLTGARVAGSGIAFTEIMATATCMPGLFHWGPGLCAGNHLAVGDRALDALRDPIARQL